MGILKRIMSWKNFSKVYLYTSIIAGALMLQVSTYLGIHLVVQGFVVSYYPLEEESKTGRRVVEIACYFSFVSLAIACVAGSFNLITGVLALIKNPV